MSSDKVLRLPPPVDPGGKSVYQSLLARRTIRELSAADLTLQEISNILWAAKGVNRASSQFGLPGLTAASASNSQEVDVYVALRAGCYRFEPLESTLHLIVEGDHRRLALTPGQQLDVPLAPLQLIYVADVDKLVHTKGYQEPHLQDPEFQKAYYFVDTGLIAGNVYLYTASVGLGSWFHNCSQSLKDTLKLGKHQRVLFAQSVGHPG
jgi:nitroreductase